MRSAPERSDRHGYLSGGAGWPFSRFAGLQSLGSSRVKRDRPASADNNTADSGDSSYPARSTTGGTTSPLKWPKPRLVTVFSYRGARFEPGGLSRDERFGTTTGTTA
jgi:hypothetical protein